MSESDLNRETPLESRRVPLEREVVLEYEHFASFIKEYSANISLGGMFVKTERPHEPETVFRFEVRLTDDAPLIAGLAKVLWVRQVDEGEGRPSGMGVRFLHLEAEGRSLIERIVREHMARGGQPFRLEEAVEAAAEQARAESRARREAREEAEGETPAESGAPASEDRSAVVELPPLDKLLEETRTSDSRVSLETPPRGWKPGIRAARPRTRPQLIGMIAVGAAVVAVAIYLLVGLLSAPPVLDKSETEPVELPRAPEPVEEPPPPFTAVEEIRWQRARNGAEIVVRLDGSVPDGSWEVERISDPPRHLLKFAGATRPYPTETLEVGFGGVRELRTGYHDTGAGNEQHVMIELVDPRVVLEESTVEGTTVRLRFRRLP